MKRECSETTKARRYVARCAAAIISRAGENAWLYEDDEDATQTVDDLTVRRRKKALERLARGLMKQAGERGGR